MNRYESFHFTVDTDETQRVYKAQYIKERNRWDIIWNDRVGTCYGDETVQKWLKTKEWIVQEAPNNLPTKFNFTYKGYPGYTHHAKLVDGFYKIIQARGSWEHFRLPVQIPIEGAQNVFNSGHYIIQDEEANKERNQELRDAEKKVFATGTDNVQARLNGWPEWDKLPDNFVFWTGLGKAAEFHVRKDGDKYICKDKIGKDWETKLEGFKGYGSMKNGWTYQGEYIEPVKEVVETKSPEVILLEDILGELKRIKHILNKQ